MRLVPIGLTEAPVIEGWLGARRPGPHELVMCAAPEVGEPPRAFAAVSLAGRSLHVDVLCGVGKGGMRYILALCEEIAVASGRYLSARPATQDAAALLLEEGYEVAPVVGWVRVPGSAKPEPPTEKPEEGPAEPAQSEPEPKPKRKRRRRRRK